MCNIVNSKDFQNYINTEIDDLNLKIDTDKNIEISQEQIEMLCVLFKNKSNEWSHDFIRTLLKDILKKHF